jgi:hypothetical protein
MMANEAQPSGAFIKAAGREMQVGEVGFSIEPIPGLRDLYPSAAACYDLCLWADPVDDQIPRIVVTDVELYLDAEAPDALDGMRLEQSLETGDHIEPKYPWIRPGSMVGMAQIVLEPASVERAGKWDPSRRKELCDDFVLSLDRDGDRWRIEIKANYGAGYPSTDWPEFHAVFYSELEIMDAL